ncbi:electron transport complex subunit E [Psychrosphaera saromensis]|uniref:electron transport complex subunit E n=1 Tax=Psychrosphaera saromensis TaxID=716813 RepID=UPI000CF3D1C5|nr:electron transport complex subunit E [Psychrosphaera saromensis]GHB62811.1 electron transport complex subunit E [Psychrosphaera saromensis]GLQ15492.1 electron transport complex subunit E [Psychrosphaera saromensis]
MTNTTTSEDIVADDHNANEDVSSEVTEKKPNPFTLVDWSTIAKEGLWKNNPALVQLLGLCPLLAVTNTFINALGLGIATMLVLIVSNLTISLVKDWVTKEIRIPVFIMIIASFVTIVELLMNAYTYGLYLSLGIFIPLIVTNCAIIGRAEAFASKNPPINAAFDGFMMGLGFMFILLILGGVREILGQGTLFYGAHLLFGEWANDIELQIFQFDQQFLLAILPPGAFIGMGFIIAGKNYLDNKQLDNQKNKKANKVERARVTTVN